MNYKNIIYLILILTLNIYSQECIVIAKSGLNVRKVPSLIGKKIGKVKFKEKLEIIKTTYNNLSVINNGKKIDGHWVKIKNKNIEGYVFDGFLEFSNLDKEFLNFTNNEFFIRVSKENIYNLNPKNEWVYYNSCCHQAGFLIEKNRLSQSYGNDGDSFKVISINKISPNKFKIKHSNGEFVPGNERIIKIIDRKNKIIEFDGYKSHRYISESNLDFYKKIDTNECCDEE